ncbi:hypothetical protein SAMN02910384_03184 [Pseudobutyrivibrio sp. ACV-2]|uniref:hypothetical protein n=2 Tax=Pseudobutyrivibrio TaxID=46205 RepID=UPI000897CE7F|nr:hypothetical protein [Pseudobutyrivibrio sp. ACV-2]SEB04245.1 hypothetical protein SAMN02910384_03184 [Pseudobutyrivibrio sp. ACV-2]
MEEISIMDSKKGKNISIPKNLTSILDKGLDDVDNGRELPADKAFDLIADLVERRHRART